MKKWDVNVTWIIQKSHIKGKAVKILHIEDIEYQNFECSPSQLEDIKNIFQPHIVDIEYQT